MTTAFVTTSPAASRIPAAMPCAAALPSRRAAVADGDDREDRRGADPDRGCRPTRPRRPRPVAPASEMPRKASPTTAMTTPSSSRRASLTPAIARAEEGEDADPAGRQRLHERERCERQCADVAEEAAALGRRTRSASWRSVSRILSDSRGRRTDSGGSDGSGVVLADPGPVDGARRDEREQDRERHRVDSDSLRPHRYTSRPRSR